MRKFFILRAINPDTQASRGFVLREKHTGNRTQYSLVKADKATLYTTKSGIRNSIGWAADALGIKAPAELTRWSRDNFIKKHFEIVEVQALLLPANGLLDALLK
jgi:hypothetical protein